MIKSAILLLFKPILTQNYNYCYDIKPHFKCAKFYNQTTEKNLLNHDTQEEADYFYRNTFDVENKCHPYVDHLACSFLFPQCRPDLQSYHNFPAGSIPPCREFCMAVRRKCQDRMIVKWPSGMDCSILPSKNDNKPCLKAPIENANFFKRHVVRFQI